MDRTNKSEASSLGLLPSGCLSSSSIGFNEHSEDFASERNISNCNGDHTAEQIVEEDMLKSDELRIHTEKTFDFSKYCNPSAHTESMEDMPSVKSIFDKTGLDDFEAVADYKATRSSFNSDEISAQSTINFQCSGSESWNFQQSDFEQGCKDTNNSKLDQHFESCEFVAGDTLLFTGEDIMGNGEEKNLIVAEDCLNSSISQYFKKNNISIRHMGLGDDTMSSTIISTKQECIVQGDCNFTAEDFAINTVISEKFNESIQSKKPSIINRSRQLNKPAIEECQSTTVLQDRQNNQSLVADQVRDMTSLHSIPQLQHVAAIEETVVQSCFVSTTSPVERSIHSSLTHPQQKEDSLSASCFFNWLDNVNSNSPHNLALCSRELKRNVKKLDGNGIPDTSFASYNQSFSESMGSDHESTFLSTKSEGISTGNAQSYSGCRVLSFPSFFGLSHQGNCGQEISIRSRIEGRNVNTGVSVSCEVKTPDTCLIGSTLELKFPVINQGQCPILSYLSFGNILHNGTSKDDLDGICIIQLPESIVIKPLSVCDVHMTVMLMEPCSVCFDIALDTFDLTTSNRLGIAITRTKLQAQEPTIVLDHDEVDFGVLAIGCHTSVPLCVTTVGECAFPISCCIEMEGLPEGLFRFSKNISKGALVNYQEIQSCMGGGTCDNPLSMHIMCEPPTTLVGRASEVRLFEAAVVFRCHHSTWSRILGQIPIRVQVGHVQFRMSVGHELVVSAPSVETPVATTIQVKNSGNIAGDIRASFQCFTESLMVMPNTFSLQPNEIAPLTLVFIPPRDDYHLNDVLTFTIQPNGRKHSVKVVGKVEVSGGHVSPINTDSGVQELDQQFDSDKERVTVDILTPMTSNEDNHNFSTYSLPLSQGRESSASEVNHRETIIVSVASSPTRFTSSREEIVFPPTVVGKKSCMKIRVYNENTFNFHMSCSISNSPHYCLHIQNSEVKGSSYNSLPLYFAPRTEGTHHLTIQLHAKNVAPFHLKFKGQGMFALQSSS